MRPSRSSRRTGHLILLPCLLAVLAGCGRDGARAQDTPDTAGMGRRCLDIEIQRIHEEARILARGFYDDTIRPPLRPSDREWYAENCFRGRAR